MFTLRKLTILAVATSILAIACAPKKNAKQNIRGRARTASAVNMVTGQGSGSFAGSSFGAVYGYDQNFTYAAQLLAQGAEVQINYVSPQPAQNQGIYFVAKGLPHYNSPTFTTGEFQLEIWDDQAPQSGPVVFNFSGANAVSGQSYGGQVSLTFTSQYEAIYLQGYVQGQNFQGTISFANAYTTNMTLGEFSVPACGFFRCQ